ncbi:MAG: ATPase [Clostridia bacterium]|nr:ATPase [Clostridia bacterium]
MNNFLGIEFGSTRIKAVVIDENYAPVCSSDYTWKSSFENGIWTYDINEAITGLKTVLSKLECKENIKSIGISGMMHGYLAFDKEWNLLVPFRTWQNTITAPAAAKLTELFNFNVPQRWSIAHLYQAVLNGEEHINKIAHITTLAGYMHYLLTGVNAVGIGEASGIFPIDSENLCYNKDMISKLDKLLEKYNLSWKAEDVLPSVLLAGDNAGYLTEKGSKLVDGLLPCGITFAPPEGDAGTGMTATNAVAEKTGNISAGTSIFSMVVLNKPLKNVYEEIDIVTTPTGKDVALVHCNNCTNDINAWVSVLKETAALFGAEPSSDELYTKLYEQSLNGDTDCGGVLVCNYMAGEGITHFDSGVPMVARAQNANFTLANLFRSMIYSTMSTLKLGMDILAQEEVEIDSLTGHGGLFKTEGVGARYMAAACNAPIAVMKTAGEGGPYGMALLAAYASQRNGETLEEFLLNRVFENTDCTILNPQKDDIDGFNRYIEQYKQLLKVEETATKVL